MASLKNPKYSLSCLAATAAIVVFAIVTWTYLSRPEPFVMDEAYMAVCVDYHTQSPLAMLVFYVGRIWTDLFGTGFLSLRHLSWLVGMIAVFIGGGYYYYRTRRLCQALWLTAFCVILAGVERASVYSWDSGPVPYYVISIVLAFEYLRRRGMWLAFWFGCSVTLLFLARAQLVVLVPFFGILIYFISRKDSAGQRTPLPVRLTTVLCYTAGILATFILMTTLMCGSVEAYIDSFRGDNIISGHSPADWYRFYYNFKEDVCRRSCRFTAVFAPLIIAGWWCLVPRIRNAGRLWGTAFLLLAGFGLGWIFTPAGAGMFGIEGICTMLIVALLLSVPVYNVLVPESRIKIPRILYWICWIYYFIPAFGSDYWFARFYGFFYFAPMLAVFVPYIRHNSRLMSFFKLSFVALFITFTGILAGRCYESRDYARYSFDEFPKCEGIYGGEDTYREWLTAKTLYDALDSIGARVNFDGDRYGFTYCFQEDKLILMHEYHMGNNPAAIEYKRPLTDGFDAWLFVFVRPKEFDVIGPMLVEQGFVPVETDTHYLYLFLRPEFVEPLHRIWSPGELTEYKK